MKASKLINLIDKIVNPKGEDAKVTFSGPTLRIGVGDKHIATLYHDGANYCLTYEKAFFDVKLAPFNPKQVETLGKPETGKVYKNETLWLPFASRLPSKDRADYKVALQKHNLSGEEHPLEILGKIGTFSISKPWHLELVKN